MSICQYVNMSTFVKPSKKLDVWESTTNIFSVDEHRKLIQCIAQMADATKDFFCPKYQNIVDPNLFMFQDVTGKTSLHQLFNHKTDDNDHNDKNANEILLDQSETSKISCHKWIATDVEIKNSKALLKSSIQFLNTKTYKTFYSSVEKILTSAWPILTQIENWCPYNVDSSSYGDIFPKFDAVDEYDYCNSRKKYQPEPFVDNTATANATEATARDKFQIVAKCQRVIVEPGVNYKGLWHDEGLNENVIAVIVYYTKISESLKGGAVEFANKGNYSADFGRREEIQKAWSQRDKVTTKVSQGSTIVFSNYQTVHRVLEIENTSNAPQVREFICLFVIDPRTPLLSTRRHNIIASTITKSNTFDKNLFNIIFRYCDIIAAESQVESLELRKTMFMEQMKPKTLGRFCIYATGNLDCQSVGWCPENAYKPPDWNVSEVQGTESDVNHGNNQHSQSSDEEARTERYNQYISTQDEQTVAF